MPKKLNLSNLKFGRLTVIREYGTPNILLELANVEVED